MGLTSDRGPSFFALLAQQGEKLVDASALLREILAADPEDRPTMRDRLHDIEHEADEINHRFIQKINQSFVTPFDREDMSQVAHLLDDCIDLMDEAGDLVVLYNLGEIPAPFDDLIERQVAVLRKCSKLTAEAMPKLKKPQNLKAFWLEINILENQGDQVYRRTLASLFDSGLDPLTIIKLKDLILILEKCTDAFESLAHEIETIAVKES